MTEPEHSAEFVSTRVCCGQRHHGPVCPDGMVMCCLCFERVPQDRLAVEDGQKVDVCQPCRDDELERTEDERPWPTYHGREMRGGLRRGHWHMAYVSTPVLKGPGAWIDCPACVEWAEELRHSDGSEYG